jgi:hypothetical protein
LGKGGARSANLEIKADGYEKVTFKTKTGGCEKATWGNAKPGLMINFVRSANLK